MLHRPSRSRWDGRARRVASGSGPEPKFPGGNLQGTAAPAPPQGAERVGLRGPSLPWGYLLLTDVPSISVPFGEF